MAYRATRRNKADIADVDIGRSDPLIVTLSTALNPEYEQAYQKQREHDANEEEQKEHYCAAEEAATAADTAACGP